MQLNFDIWIRNKNTDDEIVIKNNTINTDTLRIRYNPNTKQLIGNYKTMFNYFKNNVNKRYTLWVDDTNKRDTTDKQEYIHAINNDKKSVSCEYGKYGYSLSVPNHFDELFKHCKLCMRWVE